MHRSKTAGDPIAQTRPLIRNKRIVLTCIVFLLAMISTQTLQAAVAGHYLYIVDSAISQIEGFSINPANGVLASLGACANVVAGAAANSLRVDPTGSYVYAADPVGKQIYGYAITPATGCLALIPGAPWATAGNAPSFIRITADGRFVYVTDVFAGAASVEGFQILPGGILAPVPGGPVPYGVVQGGLAIDSVGPYMFAADMSAPTGPITPFQYNAAGTPFPAPGCPGPCNTVTPKPFRMSATAAGQALLVVSAAGNIVDSYSINPLTGALTWVNNAATGLNPHSVAAVSFGRYAFVTNNIGNSVSSYTLAPGGAIAVNGPAVALGAGTAPQGLAIDPAGKFLYIADTGINRVAAYTINAATGRLARIAGSPFATFVAVSAPVAVAITP